MLVGQQSHSQISKVYTVSGRSRPFILPLRHNCSDFYILGCVVSHDHWHSGDLGSSAQDIKGSTIPS